MTDDKAILSVGGDVQSPQSISFAELAGFDAVHQVSDMRSIDPQRPGSAVTLPGLLERVRPQEDCQYITLHASHDDFHASLPLDEVRDRGFLIYRLDNQPLTLDRGGPIRFYIRDHSSCHSDTIDECANVKYVDRIEFTQKPGLDTRPTDDAEHEALHRDDSSS